MMKNLLRTELRKAFRNGYFLASLTLGILFVALSAWYEISLYYSDIGFLQQVRTVEEMGYVKYPLVPMSILYNSWIGGECVSVGYTLFFTLLPLLAVLPYGRSFSQEQKNGYLKVIIPRCGRTRYFASKWVATFLSGGVAVVLPLLVSLGICALVFPAVKPNVIYNHYFAFGHESMGSALFHTHPLVYTLLYLGIDFVFSGLFACLSLTTAFFFRQRLAPLVVPFLLLIGADLLRTFFLYISYVEVSPLLLMHPMPVVNATKAVVLLGWLLVFTALSVPVVYAKGRRYEIL